MKRDATRMKSILSAMKERKANSVSMRLAKKQEDERSRSTADDVSLRERARHKLLQGVVPDPFMYFQTLNIITPNMRASTLQRYTKRGASPAKASSSESEQRSRQRLRIPTIIFPDVVALVFLTMCALLVFRDATDTGVLLLREVLQPALSTDGIALQNLRVDVNSTRVRGRLGKPPSVSTKLTLGDTKDTFSFSLTLLSARNVPRCDVRANADPEAGVSLRPPMVRLARMCLFDGKKFVGNTHVVAAQPNEGKQRAGRWSKPGSTMVSTIDGDNLTNVVPGDCVWRFDSKSTSNIVVRCKKPRTIAGEDSLPRSSMYMYVEMNVSFAFDEDDQRSFERYSARTRAAQIDEVCCCWGFFPLDMDGIVADDAGTIRGRGVEIAVPLKVGRLTLPSDTGNVGLMTGTSMDNQHHLHVERGSTK